LFKGLAMVYFDNDKVKSHNVGQRMGAVAS